MNDVECSIIVVEDGIHVVLGPRRVDHDETGLTERICVIVHEYAIVSVSKENLSFLCASCTHEAGH